ncbi:MAG TPA: HipA family kinase [Actinomycetales bacterium]|nr:HipA family kinase [Actinomycetales bacterium]
MVEPLRSVRALRYVVPLREGGSLPGVVEADDDGTYVVKFRGAGQGTKALVAELLVGELARALGLPVPELVLLQLDPGLAPAEPDQEIQDLLRTSVGCNVGMDYLPGSITLDPTVDAVDPAFAARVMWLDAFVDDIDRTWRNPNLLVWHGRPWLIDHGAALWWHHTWRAVEAAVSRPLRDGDHHVLLPVAGPLEVADAELAPRVTPELLHDLLGLVPDDWLVDGVHPSPGQARAGYVDLLVRRLGERTSWLEPLEVARASR